MAKYGGKTIPSSDRGKTIILTVQASLPFTTVFRWLMEIIKLKLGSSNEHQSQSDLHFNSCGTILITKYTLIFAKNKFFWTCVLEISISVLPITVTK